MSNNHKLPLNEITRWEILNKSKREARGTFNHPGRWDKMKNRNYKPKDFDNVDFESLFTSDTFTWTSRVGDYFVTISFEGPFSNLYMIVGSWSGKNRWKKIDLKLLTKCLSKALDEEDLYINCTCDDFKYRFAFHVTQAGAKYGLQQNRPPTIRNVKNNQGFCCKHILAVLYGKRWVQAAAKTWLNYIRANPEVAEEMIWG